MITLLDTLNKQISILLWHARLSSHIWSDILHIIYPALMYEHDGHVLYRVHGHMYIDYTRVSTVQHSRTSAIDRAEPDNNDTYPSRGESVAPDGGHSRRSPSASLGCSSVGSPPRRFPEPRSLGSAVRGSQDSGQGAAQTACY